MIKYKISIIIATYNCEHSIVTTLENLQIHIGDEIELIVIDGGSSDGTVQVIENRMHMINYFVSEPDSGIYDAWNKGIDKAQGLFVAFLGSGDRVGTDYFSNMISLVNKNEFNFIHAQAYFGAQRHIIGKSTLFEKFKRHMLICHVGALHHRSLFEKYGKFDTSFKIAGDFEFLLRAYSELTPYFIEKPLIFMADGGVSNSNIKRIIAENYRAKLKHHVVPKWLAMFDSIITFFAFYKNKIISR